MREKRGYPLPLGVTESEGYINFSVVVESGKTCLLKLYKKGNETPETVVELPKESAVGEVRFVALPKSQVKSMEYLYEMDGKTVIDPYAKSLIVIDGKPQRARVLLDAYDWEGDMPLHIPDHEVIAYSMHVRGFTKQKYSKVKKKGTFRGIIEKIPYLQELGINQIQCMPIYHFKESTAYQNYWGYGDAYCFAVKNAYAADKCAERELKDMIKACHRAGIEVVMNLPFSSEIPKIQMMEALRYYRMEFHVDGFVLNSYLVPFDVVLSDPILKGAKILQNKDDCQFVMRRFLKGEDGTVEGLMWWLKQQSKDIGGYNYITNQSGFTLADLVSYNEKHNEDNGENNLDGPSYNCSCNYGVEGPTKKAAVLELRRRQMRNAFFLLLSAQGTPCILAGDEFANSQNGNNNVYCQDNEIAWLNWRQLEKEKDLFEYVKALIQIRKKYTLLHSKTQLQGIDKNSSGVPDISYHGEYAWQAPVSSHDKKLGVYYHDDQETITDCFVACNMHDNAQNFALPVLPKGKKWYPVFTSADELSKAAVGQKAVTLEGRTITLFEGR